MKTNDCPMVSVIVPAYNAGQTLSETITSLRAQTFPDWEAVIVDDGSTDDTATLAARWGTEDARIRLIRQPNRGVSAARNAGIEVATGAWLLFLDADDSISPNHLEALAGSLAADAGLDAVHCGWTWLAPSGSELREAFAARAEDLFPVLARRPAFVIHACIVRRSLVEAVGGFDISLVAAEDWDLWQRIARCGARFGAVREALAFYRMRVGSATSDIARCLTDGFRVIRRGHECDSRLAVPCARYAQGMPADELPTALLSFLTHYAGVVLGQGADAKPLLQHVTLERAPNLHPWDIAYVLFDAVPLAANRSVHSWIELWPTVGPQLRSFLASLEAASGAPSLAATVQRKLERLILETVDVRQPVTIGQSHGVTIEATQLIADVKVPEGVDRLHCFLRVAGQPFKRYEFPAFRVVAGETITEAVSGEVTHRMLRTRPQAAACKLRFWQELAAFTLRRRTLRLALRAVRGGSRRSWFVQWLREAIAHLAHRRTVVRAAPLTLPAREAAAWLAAIIVEERAQVFQCTSGRMVPTVHEAAAASTPRDCPEWSSVDQTVAVWERLFARPNPWAYKSGYEQTKYEQTLAMLPPGRLGRVLELACAEGHFTVQLAPRVESLTAADISPTALKRAANRCRRMTNVKFVQLNLVRDQLLGRYDLIVCSEVLYYMEDRATLAAVSRQLAEHLEPGGHLLMAHAHVLPDEPGTPGFDWDVPFGAKVIGEVVADSTPLHLIKVFRTPLYRIQLFRNPLNGSALRRPPEIVESKLIGELRPETAASVRWQPGWLMKAEVAVTEHLPILAYHRIASEDSAALRQYRVSPERFADQLVYLKTNGYYSISLPIWADAIANRRALPGRAVVLTFDDGYRDFLTSAVPLLERHGFSATVFLVADAVGGTATWDNMYGEPAPLLSWTEIRGLERDGFSFGSHFLRHMPLTALAMETVVREGARARAILERELELPVPAIAYPYGDYDPAVGRALRNCGYEYGLTCRADHSRLSDTFMELPRIEVRGSDDLDAFIAKLRVPVAGLPL